MGYVYKITNTINNKAYIGISIHEPEKSRIQKHLSGKGNRIIANAVKKHGKDAFTYEILEANVFDVSLPKLEIFYIAHYNTVAPNGYNLTYGGDGASHLEQTRCKISESKRGKPRSAETRLKLSKANKGKKHSEDTRRKISEGNKGKQVSAETRFKLSKINKGKKHSEDTRRKLSESRRGKTSPNKGKTMSMEQRRKISETRKRLPEYMPAHDLFFSLPLDMPLTEKRQLLYSKFPNVNKRLVRRWVQKWLS